MKRSLGGAFFAVGRHESHRSALIAAQAEIDKNPALQAAAAKEILTQAPKSHPEMWRLIQGAGRYIQVLSIQEQQDVINKICDTLRKIELLIAPEALHLYKESLFPLLQIKCSAVQQLKKLLRTRIYKSIGKNRGLPEIQRLDIALCVAHTLGMENLVEEVGFLKQQFLEAGAKDERQRKSIKMQRSGLYTLYFGDDGSEKKLIYNRVSQCRVAYDKKSLELTPDEKDYMKKEFESRKGGELSADDVRDRSEDFANYLVASADMQNFLNKLMGVNAVVDIPDDYHIPPNMPQLLKAWDIHPESALYQHHMAKWQEAHGRKLDEERKAYQLWLHSSDLSADIVPAEVTTPTEPKKMQRAQMRGEKHRDPEPAEAAGSVAAAAGDVKKTDPIQALDSAWEHAKNKDGIPLDRLRVVIENKNSAGSGSRCMGHLLETFITIGPDGEKVSTERLLPSPIPLHGPHRKRAQAADFTNDGNPDTLKAAIWYYNQILDGKMIR